MLTRRAVPMVLLVVSLSGTDGSPAAASESGSPPEGTQTTLRILAYNIHHGAGNDEKLDLERIARLVHSLDPDLVALQEVDDRTERTGRVDQAAELGRLTGMAWAFGSFMDYEGGRYGMAVLSALPFAESRNHRHDRPLVRSGVVRPIQCAPLPGEGLHDL